MLYIPPHLLNDVHITTTTHTHPLAMGVGDPLTSPLTDLLPREQEHTAEAMVLDLDHTSFSGENLLNTLHTSNRVCFIGHNHVVGQSSVFLFKGYPVHFATDIYQRAYRIQFKGIAGGVEACTVLSTTDLVSSLSEDRNILNLRLCPSVIIVPPHNALYDDYSIDTRLLAENLSDYPLGLTLEGMPLGLFKSEDHARAFPMLTHARGNNPEAWTDDYECFIERYRRNAIAAKPQYHIYRPAGGFKPTMKFIYMHTRQTTITAQTETAAVPVRRFINLED